MGKALVKQPCHACFDSNETWYGECAFVLPATCIAKN